MDTGRKRLPPNQWILKSQTIQSLSNGLLLKNSPILLVINGKCFEQKFNFEPQKARYVKLRFKNGKLPHKLGGFPVPEKREGELGLLFIDEIEIK
jgi:hypothetical protein